MRIKQKLFLGLGGLFGIVVLLTVLSVIFITRLSLDTKYMLRANHNSLDYSRKLLNALDAGISRPENLSIFSENLRLQQQNITEEGEKQVTDSLEKYFLIVKQGLPDSSAALQLRKSISGIMMLNMQAIERKGQLARDQADAAIFWVMLVGTICFIIALTLLFNLPGNIANPIRELTESIKEIAGQNYNQRVHYPHKNEFGELATSFNVMAEKLDEYQKSNIQKLLMEKRRIETLINNMHDPVIGLDEQKRILFMNEVALHIAGLKKEEVLGASIEDIARRNDLIRRLVQDIFYDQVQDKTQKGPVKIYANGRESYFDMEMIPINIVPTGEKSEKLIGNVILLQNITPYKELDFAKTNFIATVSHELKTPIASIKMSLQLLENDQIGSLNDEQKQLVASIQEDAGRLLRITGELLNITQVESGSVQLNMAQVSPAELIGLSVENNKTAAGFKHLTFDVKADPFLPGVLADKEKTVWVLNNLISNAIRYSYEHSTIFIDAIQQDTSIRISVTDTGQGIAPEYIDKIFDRYFRIPGSKKEGTGLGLSICKEFIEAQGGTIQVSSELGVGSTFSITLKQTL